MSQLTEFQVVDGDALYTEIDLLRSINAELVAALEVMRDEYMKLQHSLGYSFTNLPKIEEILERAKQ